MSRLPSYLPRKVLCFSREAGGAAAVAPVCHALKQDGWPLLLLAKGPALTGFPDRGLDCQEVDGFNSAEIEALCRKHLGGLPDVLFTSATSLPSLDLTERLLWRWASEHKIPSAALIDQWQNYAIRFSGVEPSERLAYLPDRILVMDEMAAQEADDDGLPSERLEVTGQPGFDAIIHEHQALAAETGLRARFGLPEDATIVTFAAEALRQDFGDSLGYDEQSVLTFVGNVLNDLAPRLGKLLLAVKLHPQNRLENFTWAETHWPNIAVRLFARDITPRQIIAASDFVVGMSSVMLVEAILAGLPTMAFELEARREPQCIASRAGAIPHLPDREQARAALEKLLTTPAFRAEYLARQAQWGINGDAVGRCLDALSRLKISSENE